MNTQIAVYTLMDEETPMDVHKLHDLLSRETHRLVELEDLLREVTTQSHRPKNWS